MQSSLIVLDFILVIKSCWRFGLFKECVQSWIADSYQLLPTPLMEQSYCFVLVCCNVNTSPDLSWIGTGQEERYTLNLMFT